MQYTTTKSIFNTYNIGQTESICGFGYSQQRLTLFESSWRYWMSMKLFQACYCEQLCVESVFWISPLTGSVPYLISPPTGSALLLDQPPILSIWTNPTAAVRGGAAATHRELYMCDCRRERLLWSRVKIV